MSDPPLAAWGRRAPAAELSPQRIAQMMRPVAQGELRAARLTGGGSNTLYRVDAAEGSFLLRAYTRPGVDFRKEWHFLEVARQGGVPVPEVLHVEGNDETPHAVLRWVEGEEPGSEAAFDVGQVLVRIGRLRSYPRAGLLDAAEAVRAFGESGGEHPFVSFVRQTLAAGPARDKLGPTLSDRLSALVEQHQSLLPPLNGPQGLVHADYRRANLVARGDRVVAVLDWEFCYAGSAICDVATMTRFPPAGFEQRFLDGFAAAGGVLPADWRRRARLMDVVNLVELLSGFDASPQLLRDVRGLLASTVWDWAAIS